MKTRTLYMLTALSLLVLSCQSSKKENAKTEEKTEVVQVQTLQKQKVPRHIDLTGTLIAYEEVYLAPPAPGKIENISVEVGSRVSKGQLLVQMDRTQLHQAEVQLNTLELDLQRYEELKKTNSIAPQKYDQFKAQYDVAKSNVDFLRKNTRLVAPFYSIVSGKYYESGEIYSGAPNTTAGKAAILTLVQINRLKVLVSISEKYFPYIKKGMKVNIENDLVNEEELQAKISNIHPTIDPVSRTFQVEITVNNRKEKLRPGMYVKTKIMIDEVDALLLPDYAVLKMQGTNDRYLFVNENNVAKRVSVTLGERYNDNIEIISDELQQGDQVVVVGQSKLLDGSKLKVVSQ